MHQIKTQHENNTWDATQKVTVNSNKHFKMMKILSGISRVDLRTIPVMLFKRIIFVSPCTLMLFPYGREW